MNTLQIIGYIILCVGMVILLMQLVGILGYYLYYNDILLVIGPSVGLIGLVLVAYVTYMKNKM